MRRPPREHKVDMSLAVVLPCAHFVEIRQRHGSKTWEQIGAGGPGLDACAVYWNTRAQRALVSYTRGRLGEIVYNTLAETRMLDVTFHMKPVRGVRCPLCRKSFTVPPMGRAMAQEQ